MTVEPYACSTMVTKPAAKIPVAASSIPRVEEAPAARITTARKHRHQWKRRPSRSRIFQSRRSIRGIIPLSQTLEEQEVQQQQSHPSPSPPSRHNPPLAPYCEPSPRPSQFTTTPSSSPPPPSSAPNPRSSPAPLRQQKGRSRPWRRIARMQKMSFVR